MHALQFVQEFAAFTGQDYASLRVVDRALADAGLRAKAKGKSMPDVTLDEGIMFLLAVLANAQPTRAAEAAREIAAFRIWDSRMGRKWLGLLARMTRRPVADMSSITLFEAVTAICRGFPKNEFDWAEISLHRGGSAFLTFGRTLDPGAQGDAQIQFSGSAETRQPKFLTDTRTALPGLLRWISEHTSSGPA